MSLDHDLEDLMTATAPTYRPAPGDLDSVMRVGRRRVLRRRVAGAAGSALALLAVVATTLSLTGAANIPPNIEEVVATTLVTTDGGVTARILDLIPDASTVVEGVEGFEILTQPDQTLTSFWDSIAEEFGWYPDLAVYRSVDGSNWTRETFQADIFDDVAFIMDAVVIDGVHTILVAWNDASGEAPVRYGVLQTRDFSDWSSATVQSVGPATLPEHLEWEIGIPRLEVVGELPAVVHTVTPGVAASARHNSWGYDFQTGWHGFTEAGESVRIPLEEVTPVGTDPTRTAVQILADIEPPSWEVGLFGPGEPGQVVVEIEFDAGQWMAVTTQPSADAGPYTFTVWTSDFPESDWIELFEASGQQAYLTDGTVYTLTIEGSAHQITRWSADGSAVPVGSPVATGGDGAHVLLAGEADALILTSGRTMWRYDTAAESWSEYDIDFDWFESLAAADGSDMEEDLRDLSEPDNNFVMTSRVVGDAVLAARSMWAGDWWIFQLD